MHTDIKNVLCIGEVLWDVLGETKKPGGAPMNVALHLSRFKHQIQIASRIGQDVLGKELITFLSGAGLETRFIQVDAELPTSKVLVSLDQNGNASYEIPEPVAWDLLAYDEDLAKLSSNAGLIIYGTLGSRNPIARKTILKVLESQAIKLIDVNLRPPFVERSVVKQLLSLADIAKFNEDELHIIAGWDEMRSDNDHEMIEWIGRHYKLKNVVVTRGGNGAVIYDSGSFYEHPGYTIQVADTVGAGDAFLAGLISSLLQGRSPDEALSFACATGAYVASQPGATPDYSEKDVIKFIK